MTRKLGRRLYELIKSGVSMMGTFDPDEIMYIFEEDLTPNEHKRIKGFLSWVHKNNKKYGSGNYEEVYSEYLEAK